VYARLGKLSLALDRFTTAAQLASHRLAELRAGPSHGNDIETLPITEAYATALMNIGMTQEQLGQHEPALQAYQKAETLIPEVTDPRLATREGQSGATDSPKESGPLNQNRLFRAATFRHACVPQTNFSCTCLPICD
jgi:tetratricopeptide (TPR) repeat protein